MKTAVQILFETRDDFNRTDNYHLSSGSPNQIPVSKHNAFIKCKVNITINNGQPWSIEV